MKKTQFLFILLVMLLACSATVWAQPNVNIPDPNFKGALVANSAINTNLNAEIDSAEAAVYTGPLNVSYLAITNLTGIEAFTSLTNLNVNGNLLSTVDLSNNIALTDLYINHNQLANIDVSNNINLYHFDVSNNLLNTLDLSNNLGLYHLNCGYNSISTLNLDTNTYLHELYCDSNQLSFLDLYNNTSLYQLYCTQNLITTLDVSPLYNLAVLFADENPFSCVDISYNYFLTNLSVQNCPNLQKLNLKNGNNGFLSPVIFGCPVLTCIQVDDTAYANLFWGNMLSGAAYFSLDCGQPIASFTHNAPVCQGTPVAFDQTLSNVDSFKWHFGDGNTSTANDPSHLYVDANNYYVQLETKNCYGTSVPYADVILGTPIFGNLNSSLGPMGSGDILLLQYESFYVSFDTIQEAYLEGPTYFFNYVWDGDYVIKVMPDTSSFPGTVSTYSGDQANWETALIINHSCFTADSLDIFVLGLIPPTPGTGSISGEIIEGVGFGRAQGDPVHGVDVKLGVTSNAIMATTTTDTLGMYSFTGVPPGTYTIYVDIAGLLKDSSYTVTIDSTTNTWTYLDYIVDSASIYIIGNVGVEGIESTDPNVFDVYPNPVKTTSNIRYAIAEKADVQMNVFNSMGIKVGTLVNNYHNSGEYMLNFNPSSMGLKSGIYFITVTINGKSTTKKIVVLD